MTSVIDADSTQIKASGIAADAFAALEKNNFKIPALRELISSAGPCGTRTQHSNSRSVVAQR